MVSSLWGRSPCPWEVKVSSIVLQELSSPSTNGISGWKVETRRSVRELERNRSDELKGRTESKAVAEDLSWQPDYHTISVYHPCADSR